MDDLSIQVTADLPLDLPFSEDFETGLGHWSASNGIWQVGEATAGPGECYAGSQCAGTILAGNYPDWVDTRLQSPSIQLPSLVGNEKIHFRFWQWFSTHQYDDMRVQVSEETGPGVWSTWETEKTFIRTTGGVWDYPLVDLSAYAGKKIRVGFLLNQHDNWGSTAAGWYVDDLSIGLTSP